MHYENEKGEVIEVFQRGWEFSSGKKDEHGYLRWFEKLPWRKTREEAERDLQRYAEKRGWKRLVVLEVKVLGKRK